MNIQLTLILLVAVVLMGGCGGSSDGNATRKKIASIHQLPLLAHGQQLGYVEGFNPDNPPAFQNAVADAWAEASSAGMQISRLQIDWKDLEPAKGSYDDTDLIRLLSDLSGRSESVMLMIGTADSGSLTYPDYLMDGDALADDMRPSDPLIVERFRKLMDWVIPIVEKHKVFCISIGNEPDPIHDEDPEFMISFIDFVKTIRMHSHKLNPEIAITFTATIDSLFRPEFDYAEDLAKSVDVLCFNFYAVWNDSGFDEAFCIGILDKMRELAGGKSIIIQELGCSSEINLDKNYGLHAGSEMIQNDFFEWVLDYMIKHDEFRALYVFQLTENSPGLDLIYKQMFDGIASDEWVDGYISHLRGNGLLEFGTGRKKPAWFTFIQGLKDRMPKG